MAPDYTTVFDLVSHPERIQPAYGFYAIFIVIGLVSLAFSVLKSRLQDRIAWRATIFTVLCLGISSVATFSDASSVFDVRRRVEAGAYETAEGCLERFHPGARHSSRSRTSDEYWAVAGVRFEYGAGDVRPGYHTPEAAGGFVHSDSRVRVAFVRDGNSGRNEIVRLEVMPRACPAAPDPGA